MVGMAGRMDAGVRDVWWGMRGWGTGWRGGKGRGERAGMADERGDGVTWRRETAMRAAAAAAGEWVRVGAGADGRRGLVCVRVEGTRTAPLVTSPPTPLPIRPVPPCVRAYARACVHGQAGRATVKRRAAVVRGGWMRVEGT